MVKRVIIIGQGYTGRLSIARSVAEIGCEMTLIVITPGSAPAKHYHKPVDARSKYVKHYYFTPNHNDNALIDLLLRSCKCVDSKPVIIPDSDFAAAAVDRHLDRLEPYFHCPHIGHQPGAVLAWMDKIRQKALAKECGLTVAPYSVADLSSADPSLAEGISFPCFVKPLVSAECGKRGIGRCNDRKELSEHLKLMHASGGRKVLIEEYREISAEYATLGFSDGDHVIIPGLLELLRIAHGSHFGVAIQGKVFPVTGYEDLVSQFEAFVRTIGFVGLFDIDFYQSGGVFYFGELNLRFGGSGYAFTRMGANLPALFVNHCYGEALPFVSPIRSEAIYVNERMGFDDWQSDYISGKALKGLTKKADILFLKNDTDPAPYRAFRRSFPRARLMKTLKKWKKSI